MKSNWLSALLFPLTAIAQSSGGSFEITYSAVDPAAPALSGAGFTLAATLGQPAIAPVSAGSFELIGGFNAVGPSDVIFTNGFEL